MATKFGQIFGTLIRGSARPNFSQPSSCIALVYRSFFSRTIANQLLYDWIAEKKLFEGRCLSSEVYLCVCKETLSY